MQIMTIFSGVVVIYMYYSLLQNQLPAARKITPRGAGLQASVHGHFRTENSSSPLHITYLQALKSFFDPHIIEISSFLLLYWFPLVNTDLFFFLKVIGRKVVALVQRCILCQLPYWPQAGVSVCNPDDLRTTVNSDLIIVIYRQYRLSAKQMFIILRVIIIKMVGYLEFLVIHWLLFTPVAMTVTSDASVHAYGNYDNSV